MRVCACDIIAYYERDGDRREIWSDSIDFYRMINNNNNNNDSSSDSIASAVAATK